MTPDDGWVRIGGIPAYHARPDSRAPSPVVLVVHEIFGVHPHIQDICRRLAAHDYLAIAPDLYVRQGDVSDMADHDEIRKIVARVPDHQVMADLDAVAGWADSSGLGTISRLALTGFCWGGRIAWLYAAHSTRLRAAAAWYGAVEPERTQLQPRTPRDVALELHAPVLGLYGAHDARIPVDGVARMMALARRSEIVIYPDAGHGFLADYRPSYHRDSAEDGWRRMLAWFKKHGVA